MRITVAALLAILPLAPARGANPAEDRAAAYREKIRQEPLLLRAFLQEMPKGGDLHNHLGGSVYAETFIRLAAEDGLCVTRKDFTIVDPPCDSSADAFPAATALQDPGLYSQMIDALSMRGWTPGRDSAQDHFFAAFNKFAKVARQHPAETMAETVARAAAGHLQYLEVMDVPDRGQATALGARVGWDSDFDTLRGRLLDAGLAAIVSATRQSLDQTDSRVRSLLGCDTPHPDPGCDVAVRRLYVALRGFAPEIAFAQLLLGFELCQADPRFVGVNMAMAEHWYVPMRDFGLHMKMLSYFHRLYPKVHITLHAGELAWGQAPPDALRSHIRDSIEIAAAERIGHGTSVMYERDPIELLKEMAKRKVLVEICLTSNDLILGVRGLQHPLPLYLRYGVPVALATDDEGVSRSDITAEYVRAAETYNLSYRQLKQMARQSLEHSFLPGASLWVDDQFATRVPACATQGDACRRFLEGSERARVQSRLEAEFAKFESKF